jgi:hypothetical protein
VVDEIDRIGMKADFRIVEVVGGSLANKSSGAKRSSGKKSSGKKSSGKKTGRQGSGRKNPGGGNSNRKDSGGGNSNRKKSSGKPFKAYKSMLYEPDEPLGDGLNFSNEQAKRNVNIGLEAVPVDL